MRVGVQFLPSRSHESRIPVLPYQNITLDMRVGYQFFSTGVLLAWTTILSGAVLHSINFDLSKGYQERNNVKKQRIVAVPAE